MSILRVREAFAVDDRGVARVLRPGDLLDENDPIVTPSRASLFEPVEVAADRAQDLADAAAGETPPPAPEDEDDDQGDGDGVPVVFDETEDDAPPVAGVEQATADPGEKRSVTRPRGRARTQK